MKRITVLIGLLFLMEGSAYGDQAAARGTEGTQFRQAGGGEIAPQGGPRFGPPTEGLCFGPTAPGEIPGTDAVARLLRHIKLVKARAREARRSS